MEGGMDRERREGGWVGGMEGRGGGEGGESSWKVRVGGVRERANGGCRMDGWMDEWMDGW